MLIHARFSPELLEWFKTTQLPAISRGVLGEETGLKNEGLHYHCIWESDVGVESVKKRFQSACKAAGLAVARGKANAWYGGVKEWSPDMAYAAKAGKIISSPGVEEAELRTLIAVGKERHGHKLELDLKTPPELRAPVRPRSKAPSSEDKLITFCQDKYGWTPGNEFHLYSDELMSVQSYHPLGYNARQRHEFYYGNRIRKAVVEYSHGRVHRSQFVAMCRNVFYVFADQWLKEDLNLWIESGTNIL